MTALIQGVNIENGDSRGDMSANKIAIAQTKIVKYSKLEFWVYSKLEKRSMVKKVLGIF